MVGYAFLTFSVIQDAVEEVKKQSCRYTLVAIVKTVVLGDEIKQIGSFLFHRWIDILSCEVLP